MTAQKNLAVGSIVTYAAINLRKFCGIVTAISGQYCMVQWDTHQHPVKEWVPNLILREE